MRPTFIVIGAAKAGTTSLSKMLNQHPEVFVSPRKEPHYFSFDANYAHGPKWYESWFEGGGGFAQRGECSTTYTIRKVFPRSAERMAAYDSDLKLIYIARDPLERIESTWRQMRRFGPAPPIRRGGLGNIPDSMWVDVSFNRAVELQSDLLVESTNYWRELELYRQRFADEQILVLLLEELALSPRKVMRKCFEFLGVDDDFELPDPGVRMNVFGQYPVHRAALRRCWSTPWRRKVCAAIVDRLPARFCERLSVKYLRVPMTERPIWEAETRAWVLAKIGQDLELFLDSYGYPRDVWSLS